MASKSKIKGNTYERELVNYFIDQGFVSERARGSDGRSLGMAEDVDGYIKITEDGLKIKWQAKRRKSIPKWLACGNSDIVLVREDRGDSHVVLPLETFIELIRK
mgnify:CR=1 FL=1|tara:strand:+ start:1983 stop:2294 length:312 start_codon:yes stop_codon:yes gene_type:complete